MYTQPSLCAEIAKGCFGRIVYGREDEFQGEPYIAHKRLEIRRILNLIDEGHSDEDICAVLPNVVQADIDASRAFKARFLFNENESISPINQKNPSLLVDENLTYLNLAEVISLFGPSSHVRAEGLYNQYNDDEKHIWAHAISRKYKSILTADADFQVISEKWRKQMIKDFGAVENAPFELPSVIHVRDMECRSDLSKYLNQYVGEIKAFIEQKQAPYADIRSTGFMPYHEKRTSKRGKHAETPVDYSLVSIKENLAIEAINPVFSTVRPA